VGDYLVKDLILLEAGDFVIDPVCNEIGLLLMRFNLVDQLDYPIYAWDIMWSGGRQTIDGMPKRAPYTEDSLKNMILEGALNLYKNN
tara:strand:- start:1678 stop:1938 length:261 start_codon:yes stop_codon:yes gene_type:complete